jgi:hypothetical protein
MAEAQTMKLYELSDAHRHLMEMLDAHGGELSEDLERVLDALNSSIHGKVESCCRIMAGMEASEVAIGIEAARLRGRMERLAASRERLKEYVRSCMDRGNIQVVDTPLFTVRLQESPPSARWTREADQIPVYLQRVVPHRIEFDARLALSLHREGEPLPEGVEVTRRKHVVIK